MDMTINKLSLFRRAIVDKLNAEVCPICNLTADDISDDEFSCRGGLTKHIVYRGEIGGTEIYSAQALVSLIQSWVAGGSASITVLSHRLDLDKHCTTVLRDLNEPDCPLNADLGDSAGEISGLIAGAIIFTILTAVLIVVIVIVVVRCHKWNKRLELCINIIATLTPSIMFIDVSSCHQHKIVTTTFLLSENMRCSLT